MSYHKKYLKYKNKYLLLKNLRGGDSDLTIHEIDINTTLYHGSFNKITGKLNSPSYYSTDPLQSLGHLLSTSTKFTNKDFKDVNNTTVIKDLSKIATCYPSIYNYINKDKIYLLHLLVNSTNYDNTFGKIFNKNKIKELLLVNPEKINILNNFKKKLVAIGSLKDDEKEIVESNFEDLYNTYFDNYYSTCSYQCFRGWANTPGYYLLSNIDYNKYLKSIIPEIIGDKKIDGIYVERDQNEIILFNTDKLSDKFTINYILPYIFYQEKEKKIDLAKDFILDYDTKCKEFLEEPDNKEKQGKLYEKFKEFGYINGNEENKELWNFDWFFTYCENYDPYKNIEIDEKNCKTLFAREMNKNENCIKRYITNPTYLGISEEDTGYVFCDSPIFTSKLSILNIDKNSEKIKDWLLNINYFTEDKLKLSALICIKREAQLDRVL